MKINKEQNQDKCRICHQTELLDSITFICKRCENIYSDKPYDLNIELNSYKPIESENDKGNKSKNFSFYKYHEWLEKLRNDPIHDGKRGIGLIITTITTMFIIMLISFSLLPPGRYPRFILILIGLIPGLVFLYLYGLITYNMKPNSSFILSCSISFFELILISYLLTIIMSS